MLGPGWVGLRNSGVQRTKAHFVLRSIPRSPVACSLPPEGSLLPSQNILISLCLWGVGAKGPNGVNLSFPLTLPCPPVSLTLERMCP